MFDTNEDNIELTEQNSKNNFHGKFYKDYNILHPGDERRNHFLGIILGGLSTLQTITACTFSWYQYSYYNCSTWLLQSIMLTLCSLFAIYCIIWNVLSLKKARRYLAEITMILAGMMCSYCVCSALSFWLFRYWHYSWQMMAYGDNDLRKSVFGTITQDDAKFAKTWETHKLLINLMCVFTILAAKLFAWQMYVAWYSSKIRYHITRIALNIGSICLIVSSLFMIYYCNYSYSYLELTVMLKTVKKGHIDFQFALAIIGLVLATLNIINNMFRKRSQYLGYGMFLILLVFCSMIANGTLLREIRKAQQSKATNTYCNTVQRQISYKNLESGSNDRFCAHKYLPQGETCRKADLIFDWEEYVTNQKKLVRSLDPSCCRQAGSFILWPIFCLGYYTLFFTFWAFYSVGCNLFIDEQSIPNIDELMPDTNLQNYIMLIIAIILFALGIVLIFIKPDRPMENPYARAYEKNSLNGIQGRYFELVPKVVQRNTAKNRDLCHFWGSQTHIGSYPEVKLNSASSSGFSKPGFRIALLARNAILHFNNQIAPRATTGNKKARYLFFPNQKNSKDAFVNFSGSEPQVNNFLQNIHICPIDLSQEVAVYVKIEELDLSSLNGQGLKSTENTSAYTQPTPTGSSNDITSAFSAYSTPQIGSYNTRFAINQNLPDAKLIAHITTKNTAGTVIDYQGSNVQVSCQRGDQTLPSTFANSVVEATVKIFKGIDYQIKCKLTDSSSNPNDASYTGYQYNEIGMNIPSDTLNSEINAGSYQLTTKDGQYCNANDNACWNSQTLKKGKVTISVINGESDNNVNGIEIALSKYWQPQKTTYMKASTTDGIATLDNVEYDCYTAKINDPNYRTTEKKFCLQETTLNLEMTLLKKSKSHDFTLVLDAPSKNIDYDFALTVESLPDSKGVVSQCTVSPVNKYCAYARHLNDVSTKNGGTEIIEIQSFSIAYYMSWVYPSHKYQGTCGSAKLLDIHNKKTKFYERRDLLLDDMTNNSKSAAIPANISKFDSEISVLDSYKNSEAIELAAYKYKNYDYILKSCFTGWGTASLKSIDQYSSASPSMNTCKNLFPVNSEFSVQKLKKTVEKYKLNNKK